MNSAAANSKNAFILLNSIGLQVCEIQQDVDMVTKFSGFAPINM